MPNPKQIAMMLLQSHPEVAESPLGQQFSQCLQNGNDQAGEQLANSLLQSYGKDKNQTIQQAGNWFMNTFRR